MGKERQCKTTSGALGGGSVGLRVGWSARTDAHVLFTLSLPRKHGTLSPSSLTSVSSTYGKEYLGALEKLGLCIMWYLMYLWRQR